MQKAGSLWVPDGDWYFGPYFHNVGDCFEEYNLLVGLKHVKQFRCAVDGGAHVGSWARKLSNQFELVIAFEPQFQNFECASLNLDDYHNVILMGCALGDRHTTAALAPGKNSGCWHLEGDGLIQVKPLDALELKELDYLKLDVEGYEYNALKGAAETIARCHPVVQIEEKKLPHSYGTPPARSLLEEWGYKEVARAHNDFVFVHGA